jgi:hypothetical protein
MAFRHAGIAAALRHTAHDPVCAFRLLTGRKLRSVLGRLKDLGRPVLTGQAVGTLLGCVPGVSRPVPPTVRLSSRPNRGDRAHDRAGPTPVTLRQPDSWMWTGWKPR